MNFLALLALISTLHFTAGVLETVPLWPLPSSAQLTTDGISLSVDSTFTFAYSGQNKIVRGGIDRYIQLINPSKYIKTRKTVGAIKSCSLFILDATKIPEITGSDESYKITVEANGVCSLTANTVWGGLRALETFTQLLYRDGATDELLLDGAPLVIADTPRYGHRGILVDSARHYQTVDEIKRIIDSLPASKFNVLHWHMIDAESFPYKSPSEPTMSEAAFSPKMTFTSEDINAVTEYGYERGVEVLLELDVPGHAASWTKGKKEIMADCFAKYYYNINDFALNPSLDETYTTVNNILVDMLKAANNKNNKIHLGGDEVVYGCWKNDTSVVNFYNSMGYTSYDQVLSYFVNRVDSTLNNQFPGIKIIHWEEVFTANCATLPGQTIYQVWTDSSKIAALTSAKYPVIASPSNYWYLNINTNTWQTMYTYDPTQGLTTAQAGYIIGGETALWGEYIDGGNIEQNIYPRACSVAERLWSPQTVTNTDEAQNRLIVQKCRLNNRGIKSSPVKPADYCERTYI